jgi:hypothetical protein
MMMHFERKFKERYDRLWDSAVRADKNLRAGFMNGGFFSGSQEAYLFWLTTYKNTSLTIINNLKRQCTRFEDQDKVREYLDATIQSTSEDFKHYKSNMKFRFGSDLECKKLIDETLKKLSRFGQKSPTPSNSLSV